MSFKSCPTDCCIAVQRLWREPPSVFQCPPRVDLSDLAGQRGNIPGGRGRSGRVRWDNPFYARRDPAWSGWEHRTVEGMTQGRADIPQHGPVSDCTLWKICTMDEDSGLDEACMICEVINEVIATQTNVTCMYLSHCFLLRL